MYTLSELRRQVDALKRKYATELAVVKLHRLSEEFSLRWARQIADGSPAPESQPFILSIARSGFRLNTFTALHHYLERCRSRGQVPDSLGIISSLLPQLSYNRLREMLRWCEPEPESPSYSTSTTSDDGWESPRSAVATFLGCLIYLATPNPPMLNSHLTSPVNLCAPS